MKEKTKNKVVVFTFILILFAILIANIAKKDEEISMTERRKLTQFPKITFEKIVNGKTSEELDNYTVDQFIFRDTFRSIKSFWSNYIYRQKDNNGLFLKDGKIYKIEYPLKEANIKKSAEKIKNIYDKYLNQDMKIYYSLIPDKNNYLESDHLKINAQDVQDILQNTLPQMKYIDITKDLKLEDYYNTDLHWKQENLKEVVSTLEKEMKLKDTSNINYDIEDLGDFYGQLGMQVTPDRIKILTNKTIQNLMVYNFETSKNEKVYNIEKMKKSSDKYDVFLSGATALIQINNPNGPEGKELLLFRDSFGSSLAPLLIENYQKITLIDLRYISSSILNQYVKFEKQDVLFLYNTLILNQNVLK